ncbi:NnrS family protein [Arcobacter sp. FWKO B]|uniref:NnrS family protein n=1 Tax=Arcobacter sp. FWKO B TaxID=2593672 RepID=UPI0018A5F2A1|nr:NnrS family protein [Arcobacter sp. FWKO B]QOG12326.1 NnrS family protein [Arcobacter sp. FWKO B]
MFEWTTPKKKTWWERFKDQPHQLFFIATILWAVVIISYSLFIMALQLDKDFSIIHGFGTIYGVFVNAFLGFLLTVIPKYTNGSLIKESEYIPIWVIFQIGLVFTIFINEEIGKAFIASMLLYSAVVFTNTIYFALNKTQKESIWLTFLIFIASLVLIVDIFFHIDLLWYSLWLFVFPLVFVVAQRMIPAFYSVHFQKPLPSQPVWFLPVALFLFYGVGISSNNHLLLSIFSGLLAIFLFYFVARLDIYKVASPILWILAIGLLWLPIGVFALFIETFFDIYSLKLSLHILSVGFIFTLLVGFGSRVILGHSGQKIYADKITVFLFIFTQVIVFIRIASSVLFIGEYKMWIGFSHLAFLLWVVLFIIWGIRYAKTLLRIEK